MAGEVTFTPSEADYVAAHRDWFRRHLRRRGPKFLFALGVWGVGVGAVLGILDYGLDPAGLFASAFTYALLLLVVGPAAYALCYVAVPRRARRLYRQHKNLQRPFRYAWSEEGLSYASPNVSGTAAWADLHRWDEGRGSFLFFVHEGMFHFLPKRFFSDSEAEDLRSAAIRSGLLRF